MPDTETRPGPDIVRPTTVVSVRFFARYRDLAGISACEVELAEGATVGDLIAQLRADHRLESLPPNPFVAVNRVYADFGQLLTSGDEVALIPPVSGG